MPQTKSLQDRTSSVVPCAAAAAIPAKSATKTRIVGGRRRETVRVTSGSVGLPCSSVRLKTPSITVAFSVRAPPHLYFPTRPLTAMRPVFASAVCCLVLHTPHAHPIHRRCGAPHPACTPTADPPRLRKDGCVAVLRLLASAALHAPPCTASLPHVHT